ncbi:MAG: response regulator [Candidatus Ancaeobacter aquaticus]|nr:response regulator [Candidatus Ancaeobacter aquaticus]
MPSNHTKKETNNTLIKILVIDDEESISALIEDILSSEGYDVMTASGGEKGVEIASKDKFDLIMVDVMMPGINGIETIKRIRKKDHTVSIIILSAYGKRKDAVIEAENYGVFDYITKPFDIDYLLSLIKYVLHRAKFGKLPYMETMQNYYGKSDVSQKQLIQKKWYALKEQVEQNAQEIELDKKRIEKDYISKIARKRETIDYYIKHILLNKYALIVIGCLMLGLIAGYFYNKASMTDSQYNVYVNKIRGHATSSVSRDDDKVTLSDFYHLMKNIEGWMRKDVEQERKHFKKFGEG